MDQRISEQDQLAEWVAPLRDQSAAYTLLAVCPTSDAVLRGALAAASDAEAPLLIAATRNQVDVDGGYTGWTPRALVDRVEALCGQLSPTPTVLCCVDHGGPWCKDAERIAGVPWSEAKAGTQTTIRAALDAGYRYVHIDTTIDPHEEGPLPVETMVQRTQELLSWTEAYRQEHNYSRVTYEVGIEEVAPAAVDDSHARLDAFLTQLYDGIPPEQQPTFVVSDVGTSFGTGQFDTDHARQVVRHVRSFGALVKAHYSDFVEMLDAYPRCGVGGANIGPGLSAIEYESLCELESLAKSIGATPTWHDTLRDVLVESGRWRKWTTDAGADFDALSADQQETLLATGSRYVWAHPAVEEARASLYDQVAAYRDGDAYVTWRLRSAVTDMMHALNVVGRLE
ncbi:MAG: class II D-tagatose-bisphosphate aldolase, non-catalytic subunit [Longimonas sp.]|uniref:class II D-tagatose-bisphosphate aldolase non-catalytic subunit n=1 Tax=Longimonas sp. TaxID=2039626 RepID=UPI003975FF04